MDGKLLLYSLRHLLQEDSDSLNLDEFSSYQYLWDAAVELNLRTKSLRGEITVTTVASTANYALDADFLELYLRNSSKQHYIKYYDGSTYYFPLWKPYEEIIYANQMSTEAAIPNNFTIRDKEDLFDQITGTTTSDGASSGGQCTLTDTSGLFTTTDYVSPGDIVHNTTDGSMGIVLSITSATGLVAALFGGTNDDWTSGDAYVIQPQARYEIYFDPIPSTAAHTATVFYLKRPAPVFSDYGVYRFPAHYTSALVKYAAWLYKYRDREPNYGDQWYQFFDRQTRLFGNQTDNALRRRKFSVNLRAG